jgi:DNA-binding FadR family transcriptional regulator
MDRLGSRDTGGDRIVPRGTSTAGRGRAPTARTKRGHDNIADRIGIAIVNGVYRPGDTLPGEIEFSEQLGVSRTVLREAIRTLVAKGMVESRPKSGTRVLPRRGWSLLDPTVLGWMFEGEVDPAFLRDLFELRVVIEPAVAALAAQRRSGQDLARMGHALEEMAAHGLSTAEGQQADQRFHDAILDACGNEALQTLAGTISASVRWTTIFKQRKRKLPRDPLPDHQAIYLAIADGDVDAARAAMAELVRLALRDTELSMDA